MTSEVDCLKTNEFLRRRKLRLQQVREQSKDVAKKIRQRAKVEKLRQVVELDSKKQKEYLHRQERLVKQLEEYYAKGIENVGSSHRNASEIQIQDDHGDKVDLSKQRGKVAAAELRKKRQQILNKQKKLLDRKLQAREAANEISRDKSAAVVTKLQSKPVGKGTEDTQSKSSDFEKDSNTIQGDEKHRNIARNDMATQWDIEETVNEWEPNIPTLAFPKDDNTVKESNNNIVDSKSDKNKKFDLFALSEEMPSSLRGGLTTQEERVTVRPSLTLVSEYLQNRVLRLREPDTPQSSNKMEDLQSLKQTILRTRASKEGIVNVCHVLDEEFIPMPTWQAEHNSGFCNQSGSLHKQYNESVETASVMQFNKRSNSLRQAHRDLPSHQFSSLRPTYPDFPNKNLSSGQQNLLPSPHGTSRCGLNRFCLKSSKGNIDKTLKSSTLNTVPKRNSVTMYNHNTRDTRNIPCCDERLVLRDLQADDDAYSQAMKESSSSRHVDKDKKTREVRSKVAMTKQNVEKEYRDTISFLNALPKDKENKTIKTAFMNEQRQQMQKENRQQKLQQEYRKIEKECSQHRCKNKSQKKGRSPTNGSGEVFENTDFQYSWMPVPEGDGNLAIHTIPTSLKEVKSTNSVKFSKVDSYHEYRSRHKHTPPTKDTAHDGPKTYIEAVVIQSSSDDSESASSDTSENIRLEKNDKTEENAEKLSDPERIIIYKILDSKIDKRKKNSKFMKEIAKSLTLIGKQKQINKDEGKQTYSKKTSNTNGENRVSFEHLNEGVYTAVNENGDNISSMYFNDRDGEDNEIIPDQLQCGRTCSHVKKPSKNLQNTAIPSTSQQLQHCEKPSNQTSRSHCSCESECGCKRDIPKQKNIQSSNISSNSSFKTAKYEDAGFIKLMEDVGQEASKFYIGASGFIKDNDYEVVIQLRKKGDDKGISNENPEDKEKKNEEKPSSINRVPVAIIKTSATQTSGGENNETSNNEIEPATAIFTTKDLPTETKKSGLTHDAVVNIASEVLTTPNSKETLPRADAPGPTDNVIINKPNNMSDKGVSTSFQDTYAIPEIFPKSDPIPRPATSTYTQTSMSSPNHRPVFFHMSSSTSTAYMSPPEIILPKFLMQDYHLTDEEYPRSYDMEEIELTETHENTTEYDDYRCNKCIRTKKISSIHQCRKHKLENARTPPNSTRSAPSEKGERIFINQEHTFARTHTKKKSKCKCRKCENHNRVHNDVNLANRKNSQRFSIAKHSPRNHAVCVTSAAASSNMEIPATYNKNKINLKPIIKNYVDQLLVLNKESLKAVQVIDQDCSSVATPGSSIIEVPNNIDQHKTALEKKLSLQKIKVMLRQKIIDESEKRNQNTTDNISNQNSEVCLKKQSSKNIKVPRWSRKKSAHKVKSLNISKKMSKVKKTCEIRPAQIQLGHSKTSIQSRNKIRSKSSPTLRLARNSETTDKSTNSDLPQEKRKDFDEFKSKLYKTKCFTNRKSEGMASNRATITSTSLESDENPSLLKGNVEVPIAISTQTSINVNSEINFMKLAEDKLQNMEKIADLTEKCTQRLSNLAKVLEEVRKNKILAYSQISTSDGTSDSDQKSDKNLNRVSTPAHVPFNDINKRSESNSPLLAGTLNNTVKENVNTLDSTDYIPFLRDIPKPAFKSLNSDYGDNSSSSSSKKSNSPTPVYEHLDLALKNRAKPPPALSRINLKHEHDVLVPHELSTVLEVDSPLSVKLKSTRKDANLDVPDTSNRNNNEIKKDFSTNLFEGKTDDAKNNPDMLDSNVEISNEHLKMTATGTSDNSKVQMMDIRKFNDIMLKPFCSIQEYAKKCNVGLLDDGSNLDDIVKDDQINDELSSLYSEASLPDVISELLKRNIISEPFKYDTRSNTNSTTVSSESTISVLALSKTRQGRNKVGVMLQNKENSGETSDTLSISSNPDLENAFKKLGMGWASSTLKKTKERLALSSSSNTSTSSLSQFRVRNLNQDVPVLVTDSSVPNYSKKPIQHNAADSSKHAEQQTSLSNSMTVKEFLTNELAKKITFNNKSRNDTEELVSLFETKMPEEMNHSSRLVREENSIDNSTRSGNNRARTSTPVQLFKSMTYHSSSSSNISNGLFSNADDLSSVKVTSNSMKHSTSDKDDLIIPNFSLRMKRGSSENSKSD